MMAQWGFVGIGGRPEDGRVGENGCFLGAGSPGTEVA